MNNALPDAGAANEDIACLCQQTWREIATKAGIDLAGFDPDSSLAERLDWALSHGLDIGAILSRFSSKMQHSTASQVHDCTEFAAWHRIYVPPEFVCVDEAVSGRKSRRDGLDRMKVILQRKLAGVLLVFKLSRLFRAAYKGYAFFQEDVVDEGLRGISIRPIAACCLTHATPDVGLLAGGAMCGNGSSIRRSKSSSQTPKSPFELAKNFGSSTTNYSSPCNVGWNG